PFYYRNSQDLTLGASVYLEEIQKRLRTVVDFSVGTMLSLDDLFNRICCNKHFIAFSIRGETLWNGTDCFWPQTEIIPRLRYYDYNPIRNSNFNFFISTDIGMFYSGIPIKDDDRMYLASLMSFIAKFWIMFHEESHYWHGHLHFAQEHRINSLLRISENGMKIEQEISDLYRTFEWQADRNATSSLVSLFFGKGNMPYELPNYLKKEELLLESYFRILFCAVGSLIMIFQKSNILMGGSSYYPSTQTRLTSMFGITISSIIDINRKGKLWVDGIDEQKLQEILINAEFSALLDLMAVEDIITDEVEYDNDKLKSNLDLNNVKNLNFIPNGIDELAKVAQGIVMNLDSGEKKINEIWFDEYRQLVGYHNYIYDELLVNSRKKAELNGNSPY
ncbi:MAG: hypothetical protein SFU25_06905, partial [Candidatus Caenarcaniphilales bacterium]|nr:hypothetical protein [Candidatus Caenarcaniphilales bacterium]